MLIDTEDKRLLRREKDELRRIALRLRSDDGMHYIPALPPGYAEEMRRVFGDCGEGDRDRWQPGEK